MGRDWLQLLCLMNIDACKNTQETFILFRFISVRPRICSEIKQNKTNASFSIYFISS